MSDEETTTKRKRSTNPFSQYKKAKTAADRARRAYDRADDLREKAEAAAYKAEELRKKKDALEEEEAKAYDVLQEALAALDTDTDEVADDDEEEDDGDE